MDFAVFIGEEKTLIYKKGQGIVLNEPSIIAVTDGKVTAVGKTALQFLDRPDTVFKQVIRQGALINVEHSSVFVAAMLKKVGTMCDCLVCIPSSLDQNALNDYKTAVYTAGVADATFIPSVIASAYHAGFKLGAKTEFLSVITDGESADMAVLCGPEIIDGGTLHDLSKFDLALTGFQEHYPNVEKHLGDRMSVINGAGELLSKPELVRKIVEAN
ncbi:MAG: rod shape-determining protein [Christensenellaceae bacterium]|nr:rod shape-determining protein [Christensenellaceae bacterium]